MPLRHMVVFPASRVPFVVGRLASVEAVRAAVEGDGEVLLVMQRDPDLREPAPRDLHSVGTIARIVAETRLADGNYKLVVEGVARARVTAVVKEQVHLSAQLEAWRPRSEAAPGEDEARRRLQALLDECAELRGSPVDEEGAVLAEGGALATACDELAVRLPLESDRKQEIAVMRSLGAGRSTVMTIVLLESVMISLVGGLLGWLAGHALIGLASGQIEAETGVIISPLRLAPPMQELSYSAAQGMARHPVAFLSFFCNFQIMNLALGTMMYQKTMRAGFRAPVELLLCWLLGAPAFIPFVVRLLWRRQSIR